MNDIGFFINPLCANEIDVEIENGDLRADEGLETAVLISLFTDARVTTEELPSGQTSRRGWWGDLFSDKDNDRIGSKIWVYESGKQINRNIPLIESAIKESLNWLIQDGVASNVGAVVTYPERGFTKFAITITKPTGSESRFSFLWDGQEIKRG